MICPGNPNWTLSILAAALGGGWITWHAKALWDEARRGPK